MPKAIGRSTIARQEDGSYLMKGTTSGVTPYKKYEGRWLDALNLQSLMELMSDFLMDGGRN